jgi:protein TonB
VRTATYGSSSYLDEPWRRLVLVAPVALAIWGAILTGFALLLAQTSAPPPEEQPLQARIIEIPPPAGLQAAPAHPATALRPEVHKPARTVHPHVEVHPRAKVKAIAPPMPISPEGTAKAPPIASAPSAPAKSGPATEEGSSGSAIGNDNQGARAIFAPTPEIPDDLREQVFESVAVAHFKVGYDGVVEVSLTKPTENPQINQMLLDALKQWRFFPAMRQGVAVASEFDMRIPIAVR